MEYGIFKNDRPVYYFVVLFLLVLVSSVAILFPSTETITLSLNNVHQWANYPKLETILFYLLLACSGIVVRQIILERELIRPAPITPILVMLAGSFLLLEINLNFAIVFALLLTLLAVRKTLFHDSPKSIVRNSFDAAFFIGLAAFLYVPFLFLYPFLLLSLLLFNRFKLRLVLVSIYGFAAPWLIGYAIFYYLNKTSYFPELTWNSLTVTSDFFYSPTVIGVLSICAVMLVGLYFLYGKFLKTNSNRRSVLRNIQLWLLGYVVIGGVSVSLEGNISVLLCMLLVPFCFYNTFTFYFAKKRAVTNSLLLFFGLVIVYKYFNSEILTMIENL
jgi:hypothetical protein